MASGIRINNNVITHMRGDTGIIELDLTIDGKPYTMQDGDTAVFSVKKSLAAKDVVLQKRMEDGKFTFLHSDTQDLAAGTYKYDIQVTLADGQVITVVGPADYRLLPDVTTNL